MTALLCAAGLLLCAASLLPYAFLRQLGDLLARDGSLELLTPGLIEGLRPFMLLSGLAILALGLTALLRPQALRCWSFFSALPGDARAFWQDLRCLRVSGWEWLFLALAAVAGAYARLALMRAPIHYDEAYTFMAYAIRPVWSILSDYSLPNNHVLHTLLVKAATAAFGSDVWAIRLPAFLAGLAMIPAAYLAARAHYNRSVGLLAAALVAGWPYLVHYAADARGYSLVGLFTLLLFALGPYLLARQNRFGWLLVVLLASLGLFTVPVMAYTLGVFYAWLLLSVWAEQPRPGKRLGQMLLSCLFSGLAVLALTGLLYAPILLVSGPRALFANQFVRSFAWNVYLELLGVWSQGILDSWRLEMAAGVFALAAGGWLLSLGLHARVSPLKVHTSWAALAFFALVLPLQRPEMQAKAFFFLVPLLLIAVAAGWWALLSLLPRFTTVRFPQVLTFALCLAALAWGSTVQASPNLPYLLRGEKGDIEQVAIYLARRVEPGDAVLTTFPIDPQVWYYGYRNGLALDHFRLQTYSRAFTLVQPGMGQSLEQVLSERASVQAPLTPADCALEINLLDTRIYLCKPS